jgi:phytoene synthase
MNSHLAPSTAAPSNLALSFFALEPERRRAISLFYAFCRNVDDLADAPDTSPEARKRGLDLWKACLSGPQPEEPPLAEALRGVLKTYCIPQEQLLEVIAGCEMDLHPARYRTWEELSTYCHRVASVVGLVSIEIFGYKDLGCREYALRLGLALQLTNILRDVGEDYSTGGRIYLPTDELARFGCTEADIATGTRSAGFLALMHFQADRAAALFQKAREALPQNDRRAMVAAEIMRRIYETLLSKMRRDQFHVFSRRYRLSSLQKAACIGHVYLSHLFAPKS